MTCTRIQGQIYWNRKFKPEALPWREAMDKHISETAAQTLIRERPVMCEWAEMLEQRIEKAGHTRSEIVPCSASAECFGWSALYTTDWWEALATIVEKRLKTASSGLICLDFRKKKIIAAMSTNVICRGERESPSSPQEEGNIDLVQGVLGMCVTVVFHCTYFTVVSPLFLIPTSHVSGLSYLAYSLFLPPSPPAICYLPAQADSS
jgi:hypothetical protein